MYSPSINIYLVDTPGFDDTTRSDKEVLKEIATWLGDSYKHRIRLSGIIYVHRITDLRMQGSARKNLFMFKKLCGPQALQNVILVTTMWELVNPAEGEKRENQLIKTPEFWGWMMDQGSQVQRHYNTRESAMRLLEIFVACRETHAPVALDIQREIVDGKKNLDQTSAGRELDSALLQEREKFKRELAEMQQEIKEALAVRDHEAAEMIRQSQEEMTRKINELERDRADLKVSLETLHAQRFAKVERQFEEQEQKITRVTEENTSLREVARMAEESLRALTLERDEHSERQSKIEEEISNFRRQFDCRQESPPPAYEAGNESDWTTVPNSLDTSDGTILVRKGTSHSAIPDSDSMPITVYGEDRFIFGGPKGKRWWLGPLSDDEIWAIRWKDLRIAELGGLASGFFSWTEPNGKVRVGRSSGVQLLYCSTANRKQQKEIPRLATPHLTIGTMGNAKSKGISFGLLTLFLWALTSCTTHAGAVAASAVT
jgi:hypothetical protein